MKNLFTTKSSARKSDTVSEHTSKPYNSTGKHLLLGIITLCKVTSSEAVLPILPKNCTRSITGSPNLHRNKRECRPRTVQDACGRTPNYMYSHTALKIFYSPKNGRNNNELTTVQINSSKVTNYDTNSKCRWAHNLYKFATYFAQQIIRSVIFTNKFMNSFA